MVIYAHLKKITLILSIALMACLSYGQDHSCISQNEAESILGRPAHLSLNSSETRDNIIKYRCTYTANDKEIDKNKESNLYYLLEEYKSITDAEKSFAYILSQNEGMPGLYRLPGFGDEAIIQTDTINFQLIMVRKREKIVRMKVNKVTNTTSINELKRITKKITDQI